MIDYSIAEKFFGLYSVVKQFDSRGQKKHMIA